MQETSVHYRGLLACSQHARIVIFQLHASVIAQSAPPTSQQLLDFDKLACDRTVTHYSTYATSTDIIIVLTVHDHDYYPVGTELLLSTTPVTLDPFIEFIV